MQKFLVLYMAPAKALEEWMKTPEAERKASEEKMMNEWREWMQAHTGLLTGMTAGTGKTKRITKEGTEDVKNDIMLYSIAEGESHEAVAKAFEGHPHFGIPGGTIEVMPINPLPGMEGMQ
jgi:hypothetical protein